MTGRSRNTLYRKMREGDLSYTIDKDNRRKIDTSELVRVFGELRTRPDPVVTSRDTVTETEGLHVDTLENRYDTDSTVTHHIVTYLDQLRQSVDTVTTQRIKDLEERLALAEKEKDRLLTIIENQSLLLTDQRLPEQQVDSKVLIPPVDKKKGASGKKKKKGKKSEKRRKDSKPSAKRTRKKKKSGKKRRR
ncbi:MAG: hypothetical protein HQL50_02615 [Magnetococcales bacterium]|nr:hypothetical protein [Magnetococcales bacterium]